MDSNKLYASKSKNIDIKINKSDKIMEGVGNFTNGLYNNQVYQTNICENYFFPPIKNGFQPSNIVKKSGVMMKHVKKITNTPKLKKTINTIPNNKFNNIETLFINANNNKILLVPLIKVSKMNVTIRKNKTKTDMITFFHGAMFLPASLT